MSETAVDVPATGWYLTNTQPGHNKFYLITVTVTGVLTLTWGRIGSYGQCKVQKFPTADEAHTVGMRQLYAKAAKGYERIHDDVPFSISNAYLDSACVSGDAGMLNRAFWQSANEPQFEQQKASVLTHYDQFVSQAEGLMNKLSALPFDAAYAEFEELEEAWKALEEAHAKANTTLGLTRQMLQQSLMSGA